MKEKRDDLCVVHIDSMRKWYDMYKFADELYITNTTMDAMGNETVFEYNLNMLSQYQVKLALQLSILRNDELNFVNVLKYGSPSATLYELSFDFEALKDECAVTLEALDAMLEGDFEEVYL